MNWSKRIIVGSDHHEFRDGNGKMLFCVIKYQSGKVDLYDLRNPSKGATYYTFPTVRLAKKLAVDSITEGVKILEPYLDKKYYDLQKSTTEVMLKADALIKKLTGKSVLK
jgi:hypothetical protein